MQKRELPYREILFDRDRNRRPLREAERLYGERAVQLAQIFEAMEGLASVPRHLSVPPRVFVSYRWGSPEENAWVAALAEELSRRGYEVMFDGSSGQPDADVPVADIVSRIASCHIFLMIIDPGYIERVGSAPNNHPVAKGWAYIEFRISQFLAVQHFRWGFLRAGEEIPRGCTLNTADRLGDVADVRDPAELSRIVEALFPLVENVPTKTEREAAEAMLDEAILSGTAGELDHSAQLANRAADLAPGAPDTHRMVALCGLLRRREDEIVRGVDNMMKTDRVGGPASPVIRRTNYLLAANALNVLGQYHQALGTITHDVTDAHYHLVMSGSLAGVGQERAAYGHLRRAEMEQPFIKHNREVLLARLRKAYAGHSVDGRVVGELFRKCQPSDAAWRVVQSDRLEPTDAGFLAIPSINVLGPVRTGQMRWNDFYLTTIMLSALRHIPDRVFDFEKRYADFEAGQRYRVECSSCAHQIRFSRVEQILCHTCGAEMVPPTGADPASYPPCFYCGGNILTFLEPALRDADCPCPYCKRGNFARGQ